MARRRRGGPAERRPGSAAPANGATQTPSPEAAAQGDPRSEAAPEPAAGRTARAARPGWVTRGDALALTAIALAVYWLANNGEFMFFNYHLHLAVSFLNGRLYIPSPPQWLNEFAFANGKAYVYYDPFPSVFLLPFAAILGLEVNIAHVSIALGAVNVGLMRILLGTLGVARRTANWCTALFAFGTVHLFAAQYGNTWLLAHLLAVAALTLAWLEALGAANPLLLGLLSACAATSRSPALLGFPVFLVLALRRRPGLATVVQFALPLGATAILLGLYNFARFGDWFNNGYLLANQEILHPTYGSFSWHYISSNLYKYFLRLPELSAEPPFLLLTDYGISLIATTPAVLLLLRPGWREPGPGAKPHGPVASLLLRLLPSWSERAPDAKLRGRLALGACGLIFALYLCYFWDGWRQFGCRYTLDFTPFLIVALALRNDESERYWRWVLPAFTVASIAVNAWGAWWWRAHHW